MICKFLIGLLFFTHFIYCQVPLFFETKRLKTERVTDIHAPYMAQITSHNKIQEVYMSCNLQDFTDVQKQLSIINKQWNEYGYGLYIIFDKVTSDFIGFAGFHSVVIDEGDTINFSNVTVDIPEVEIYYFFMPNHWRKGYGFEIASALISVAFEQLLCQSIIAYIEPKNEASLKLIKKLNFKAEKNVMYNDKVHVLYRLK